jgi:hypothetical protein
VRNGPRGVASLLAHAAGLLHTTTALIDALRLVLLKARPPHVIATIFNPTMTQCIGNERVEVAGLAPGRAHTTKENVLTDRFPACYCLHK